METNEIIISRGLFKALVEAQNEADMLKRVLIEKRYLGITGEEVNFLCLLLGLMKEEI